MGISPEQLDFERIRGHVGHHVVAVTYGNPPVNATLECETCGMVLYSADPTMPAAQPATIWQFTLVQGGVVVQQVLAGEPLENEITNLAIVETAKALGIPLGELISDQHDAWSELLETVREHPDITVSLSLITVLQLEQKDATNGNAHRRQAGLRAAADRRRIRPRR